MAISTSLTGRLRNTPLPKSRALLPLFEAVVNAVQAVDKIHNDMRTAHIDIRIIRRQQMTLGFPEDYQGATNVEPISGFIVHDNGEGFHDKNMESFETLDSEYKSAYGCRGVGRLFWLKAFQKVEVVSHYFDTEGAAKEREFVFTASSGVSDLSVRDSDVSTTGSEVSLLSFNETYRQIAPKTARNIAKNIFEHCLWYFVRPGGAPNIRIIDGSDHVDLGEVLDEYMLTSAHEEQITLKQQHFELIHLQLKVASRSAPFLSWCAANRVVFEENISGKVPGLHGKLRDGEDDFIYACFLMSPFLDNSVRPERMEFDIPEITEGTLDEADPSMTDIRNAAMTAAEQYLHPYLVEVREAGRARVERFVNNEAPRYRPILGYIDADKLSVDPAIGDKELELQLHRHYTDIEIELLAEGQYVLDSDNAEDQEYEEKLRAYLAKVDDIKKSDLAAYVSRRRVILDLFRKAIQVNEEGKYAREDVVHSLIFPMRKTSDDITIHNSSNLWIIDEGLAFHNYLASDKPLSSMPITGSTSALEPDIVALKFDGGPVLVSEGENPPLASIVVVEIKRPMRNDANPGPEKDPLTQALRYLDQIRQGKVHTAKGRPIPGNYDIPGFCHVIADLTPTIKERCQQANLRITQDLMGYFGYNEYYKAYIEVTSFDRLLNMAHQRNRAFFDQLGLPVNPS